MVVLAIAIGHSVPLHAQSTGQISGRVTEEATEAPIAAAEVSVEGTSSRTITSDRGAFILAGVPVGTHVVRVERLGFQTVRLTEVIVRAGRTTELTARLAVAPVELEGVAVEVEQVPLIEPDVSESHEVFTGRTLRELPVDEVEEAVELATGVSDGHFRGGRVGQETYRIDGLDVKNPFDASTRGAVLELAPSTLEEIEIVTGGFGADNGSALSGVVSYVTRRGDPDRWGGRASLLTDHPLPDDLFRGFTGLSLSAGGPLPLLGRGSTLFADVLAHGYIDADPRARGLTCLRPEDGGPDLADAIRSLQEDPGTTHLVCPYSEDRLPYQRGDKLIGFLRFDRPVGGGVTATATLLHNRRQQELYTPEFKYNRDYQLGQRSRGTLLNLILDWTRHVEARAYHVVFRAAAMKSDRYLGVVDPWTFDERSRVGGFGLSDFRFLGEEFVRRPLDEQLRSGEAVPGYARAGGITGSPFGPAAEGIFFTEGTPEIINWSRSDFVGGDLVAELHLADGHAVRVGGSLRLYRAESYERTLAALPGSTPTYARFYPRSANGFAEVSLAAADEVTVNLGLRWEGFDSGLELRPASGDVFAPVIDTEWKKSLLPRIGFAAPVPGSQGRTMFRFNYARVAQPPDFQFFLDTAIGDSLRVDIRRQGNPDLTFERGNAFEAGFTHLLSEEISVGAALYLKELTNLVTGSLSFSGFAQNQFTTGDFGSVRGIEVSGRARWPALHVRVGYALQTAKGVTSGALDDPDREPTDVRREVALAFDRRHAADLRVLAGAAAGQPTTPWTGSLTASVRSGFPLARLGVEGDGGADTPLERLPWTWLINARVGRELGRVPGCDACRWSVIADARNLLGRDNVIALRRDTGTLAPAAEDVFAAAEELPPDFEPIPRESPSYSALVDLDLDGIISATEFRTVRFAALLDRNDPSLFFGSARELRLGLEVTF